MPILTRASAQTSRAQQVLELSDIRIRTLRLPCVDLLRGIVMVLMTLDHTRAFFTNLHFPPEDLAHTTAPVFFTRFVSHFCAPAFFLLAGTGAYLSRAQGKSVEEVSKFLWTRGLWLMVLDWTVMAVGWTFVWPFWMSEVLCALGCSMVIMAWLIRLPPGWVGGLGAGIILTHNLLDRLKPEAFGKFAPLYLILRGYGLFAIDSKGDFFFVLFSVIPWAGVMALGYALGALICRENWRKRVVGIGIAFTALFVILRIFHLYGNGFANPEAYGAGPMGPWKMQATLTLSIMAFLNTLKYPASLQFLLMTLGPTLIVLAWLDKIDAERGVARVLLVFGRVPLFYYVVHVYLIHILAVLVALACHQHYHWLLHGATMLRYAPSRHGVRLPYGHGLPFIYATWIAVVAMLYFPCQWFATVKQQRQDWWLRYL